MILKSRHGQSTAEYAVVISVVIAVIVGMQLYVKRGLQGKYKNVADSYSQRANLELEKLAPGAKMTHPRQYEPYYTAVTDYTINSNSSSSEAMTAKGAITKSKMAEETTRTGNSKVGATLTDDDNWK